VKRKPPPPALPAYVWSQLGPIPVQVTKDLQTEGKPCMGIFDPATRLIQIREGMDPVAALQTCAHEWIHAVLSDAGTCLNDTDEERVCDALASAIIADLLSR
jgi:Zn-dependent peptidase ImmA (M78 family)